MVYRKFAADQLFTGHVMLGKHDVLITDEHGVIVDIVPAAQAGDGIERFNGILAPGFINCHCHLELSHLKGVIAPGSGMIKFLISVMTQRAQTPEEIEQSIELADRYMYERGIVAVGDICNTTDTAAAKQTSRLYYHNFIEVAGFTAAVAEKRFLHADGMRQKFAALQKNNTVSIVPHAPYSVSEKLFGLISQAGENRILSIHNQESEDEAEFFATGKGGFSALYEFLKIDIGHFAGGPHNSLVHTLRFFDRRHTLILVHNVHTTEEDLRFLSANAGLPALYWCVCPNANRYINGRLPDIALLKQSGIPLVVGTDSLASNIELNILEEIKTLQEHFPFLTTTELLQWATSNGARALKADHLFGSFEKGKRAGLVNIDGGINGKLAGSVAKRIL